MTATGTEARVCELIAQRQQVGIKKYGTTVEANPLSLLQWMKHHRDELADALVYVQRQIEEMEGQEIEAQITGDLSHALDDKPWYPDDSGKWVEVPLDLMNMPEALFPGSLTEVITVEERAAKKWIWYPTKSATYWDWSVPPHCIGRIVAYKVVA